MRIGELVKGMKTFIPGWRYTTGTAGTVSARYCYSVWLRHLVMAKQNGLNPNPHVIAELGPGASLGIGLAALISGSEQYYGLDSVAHAGVDKNLEIFDELVRLFADRTPIPGDQEWPHVEPKLQDYAFPAGILDDGRLRNALDGTRLNKVRASVAGVRGEGSIVQYKAPWYKEEVLEAEGVDMIFSQAVLEHVDDLSVAYRAMYAWLKPAGYMSHTIDFTCHETADQWNGHWAYSDLSWKLIRGRRPYLINREPHSTHIALLKQEGFKIVCDHAAKMESRLKPSDLARRFRSISGDDLQTCGTFLQGVKPCQGGRNLHDLRSGAR
jgi:hypothetical protein